MSDHDGLYRSRDGGTTFKDVSPPGKIGGGLAAIDPLKPRHLLFVRGYSSTPAVFVAADAAQTWKRFDEGLDLRESAGFIALAIAHAPHARYFAIMEDDDDHLHLYSRRAEDSAWLEDTGLTLDGEPYANHIGVGPVRNGYLYVLTEGKLYRRRID